MAQLQPIQDSQHRPSLGFTATESERHKYRDKDKERESESEVQKHHGIVHKVKSKVNKLKAKVKKHKHKDKSRMQDQHQPQPENDDEDESSSSSESSGSPREQEEGDVAEVEKILSGLDTFGTRQVLAPDTDTSFIDSTHPQPQAAIASSWPIPTVIEEAAAEEEEEPPAVTDMHKHDDISITAVPIPLQDYAHESVQFGLYSGDTDQKCVQDALKPDTTEEEEEEEAQSSQPKGTVQISGEENVSMQQPRLSAVTQEGEALPQNPLHLHSLSDNASVEETQSQSDFDFPSYSTNPSSGFVAIGAAKDENGGPDKDQVSQSRSQSEREYEYAGKSKADFGLFDKKIDSEAEAEAETETQAEEEEPSSSEEEVQWEDANASLDESLKSKIAHEDLLPLSDAGKQRKEAEDVSEVMLHPEINEIMYKAVSPKEEKEEEEHSYTQQLYAAGDSIASKIVGVVTHGAETVKDTIAAAAAAVTTTPTPTPTPTATDDDHNLNNENSSF